MVVNVGDVNDNAPVFSEQVYSYSLPENRVDGTPLLTVTATDRDSGINAAVSYSIAPSSITLPFQLNASTGVLTKDGPIDYDHSLRQYTFSIVTTDGGSPALNGTATVSVVVTDVNDNAPAFVNTSFQFSLPRTQQGRVELTTLNAVDVDSGVNAEVVYSIVAESVDNFFSVNASTGLVALESPLCGPAAASRTDLLVVVSAHDLGVPSLSVAESARIVINIVDNNTHAPVFNDSGYTVTIPSSTRPDSLITTVAAHDVVATVCEVSSLTYSIRAGSDSSFFAVDRVNGTVTTTRALPSSGNLTFTIEVNDGGLPASLTATVDVTVSVWFDNDNTETALRRDFTLTGTGFLVGNQSSVSSAGFQRSFLVTPSSSRNGGGSISAYYGPALATRTFLGGTVAPATQVRMIRFNDELWRSDSRVRVALQAFASDGSAEVAQTQLYVKATLDAALAAIAGVNFFQQQCTIIGTGGQNFCTVTMAALPVTFFNHATLDPSREYGIQLSFGIVGGTEQQDRRLPLRQLARDVTFASNDVIVKLEPRGLYGGQLCTGEVWATPTYDATA